MCTLIIGRDILGTGTVLLAANRDERPERASEAPVVLAETPRVVGGRDAVAGGTWLAVRDARAAIAMLNRREPANDGAPATRRSRGLLALDVATTPEGFELELDPAGERRGLLERMREVSGPGLPHAALCRAFAALWSHDYAPFTLVFASPERAWLLAQDDGGPARASVIPGGWHVVTHAGIDDESEPRTARLLHELAYFRPRSSEQGEQRLGDLLRSHGASPERRSDDPRPPVCLHEGVMRTVSASLVTLADGVARLRHADGRPCERPFIDHSALLRPAAAGDADG
jgi:hypothetical protein